jgi:NADPH:quinone reductase-like Zn-dependent oxidoreductase
MATSVSTPASTAKSWVFDRYGPPEVLQLRDVPILPFRDDHEVLVRVLGSSVNPADRHNLRMPFFLRGKRGMFKPKMGRPGLDLVGRVEVVGKDVKELHVGDEVYGVGTGAWGEYAIADENQVAPRPARLTLEQAAAAPIAAVTALQGLRDKAQVQPGQHVLVNGASGGVGTFAVQIAKALGAEVDCVCSTANVELAKSLGASRVFDYSREDFTKSGQRYDIIFDTQVNHPLSAYRHVLNPGGLLLIVGAGPGSVGRVLFRLLGRTLASRIVGPRSKFFIASVNRKDLIALAALFDSGKVTPVIDRRYPLVQVPDALRYLIAGHARGKIVITM